MSLKKFHVKTLLSLCVFLPLTACSTGNDSLRNNNQIQVISSSVAENNLSAKNLDGLWTQYFSTGKSVYLLKMLEFVHENDDFMLMAGYEIVNRKMLNEYAKNLGSTNQQFGYSDIMDAIAKKYPNNAKTMQNRATTLAAAIWSIDSNRKQHPEVDTAIKNIFSSHPELDYWKRINKLKN